MRVVVGRGTFYDLYLTRELKHAQLVRASTAPAVTDKAVSGRIEVAAGFKHQLQADAGRLPGLRLLDGKFMAINQAMAVPAAHNAGIDYVNDLIDEMKTSGFVA